MSAELDEPEMLDHKRRGMLRALPLVLDVLVVLAGAILVYGAGIAGQALNDEGVNIFLDFPPVFASWVPHTGPGTLPAIVIALATVLYGPSLAAQLRWPFLLGLAYLVSLAWTVSLTFIDGWEHGVLDKLTSEDEYLREVPRVTDIPAMLREFSSHIVDFQPGAWTTHVAGHPPGVFLIFVWMDRIGLGGGVCGAALCVLIGASACCAIAITLRALGAEYLARKVLPFGVLIPAAVWIGVSADGMFAGILAWAVALLAVGTCVRGWCGDLVALAGGLILGYTLYLSYGLAAAGLLPLAVLISARRLRPALFGVLGVGLVVMAFTLNGFWWLEGLELLRIRYYQGIAETRPYGYFIWANLACLVLTIGPAVLVGLRRFVAGPRQLILSARLLTCAVLVAVLAADLSGMSKAEVERIWLPFSVWFVLPCALLPRRHVKWWLLGQAVLALLINHLLRTRW